MTLEASTDKFVPYRGAIRAAAAAGHALLFVTVHPEGQATPLYRLDVDKAELSTSALPAGGTAVALDGATIYVAGSDGQIHKGPAAGGKLAAIGPKLDPAPVAIALLSGDRLAALAGAEVVIVERKSGKARQRLALPDTGTAIAVDASGRWLVAGTERGAIAVFDAEEKDDFAAGESKKIHEGAVGALIFDPDELRVYSTGSDGKLFSTHVRGALEPEDRAGGGGHDGQVTAIALGPEDKLYTAGRDGTVKTWTRGPQKRRPSTQKDGVPSAVAIARVDHGGRPFLAVFGEDRTIRLFPLDAGGKVGDRALTFRDAYALAKNELSQKEPARRKAALAALAELNDGPAIEALSVQATEDPDHALKVVATTLLGETKSPRAQKPLEALLGAPEEQVRLAALAGLRALLGAASLRPLALALEKKKRDVGAAAVAALGELAAKDDQAMARLVEALDEDPVEVRAAALSALEALHDGRAGKKAPSAEAGLVALRSKRADIRRMALVRFHQRKLLGEAEVQAALRRHAGDPDADVRRAAFLVSVLARPALAEVLRARDKDLERQLAELAGTKGEGEQPRAKKGKGELSAEDVRPLLEAMASRALDTCVAGARGLAALQDERAFGTLLQLTNEKQPAARVEACKALSELGDRRAIQRLRQVLRDAAGEVRDAAFTALARLTEKTPLAAAEAGLLAPAEDVRGRGLTLLVRTMKKEGAGEPAVALLSRALNDTAQAVRSEAFKGALALEIGGAGAAPLRFALQSIHADVRKEVLGEVMGRIAEPWANALLLELFADPDAAVRKEAFDFSQRRTKGKAVEPLAAALSGRHADLKLAAIEVLTKQRRTVGARGELVEVLRERLDDLTGQRRTDGVRELLLQAIGDEDEKVRVAAVDALYVDEVEDALASPHADVRVRAAAARAGVGDVRALAPLLAMVTEKEPVEGTPEKRAGWADRAARALAGLADLGEGGGGGEVLAAVGALVTNKDKKIRDTAARALGWVSRPGGDLGPLYAALASSDADVKLEAAFGLALVGDPAGLPVLKGLAAGAAPQAQRGLGAAVSLGRQADDLLAAFLDHGDERVRGRALIVMMLIESAERPPSPGRCLAALASAHPRVRLLAARALEAFADPAAFAAFATEVLDDRGEEKAPWAVPAETARALAEVLAAGDPQLQGRAVRLLAALDEEKQDRFDRAWEAFQKRFGKDIDKLVAAAGKRKAAAPEYAPEELRQVVIGAYAGLSRMAGGALEMRVRQTAIARLTALGKADAALAETVKPLVLLALGDPAQAVRKLGFESLAALGMKAAELGAEALASGQRDVGVLGLSLLAGDTGDAKARRKVLEQVLLGSTDGLEEEAGKLLADQIGWEAVHAAALDATSEAARERAAAGLAQIYDASPGAQKALRGALSSRYRHVRERAAVELATKKDAAAFDALAAMLRGEGQQRAIDALVKLGDPRAPDALLDRLDDDPAGDALGDAVFAAAGSFRRAETAPRLLRYLDDKKRRKAAFTALIVVSGYDQPIKDPNEDRPGASEREATEHPRRDDVLARLLDAAYRLGDVALVTGLLPAARWARGSAVDPVLAPLVSLPKDEARHAALEAIGFRLRKRGGPADPLVAALGHANPLTQFVAAEALALAGRADGLRVLLTAIDLVPELDQRRRAVRALGELGDARALDPLLRLVNEDGHALQEEAAEAVGHLKATPRGKAIEELLLRLATGLGGVALSALTGLRWFDSREGWAFVRGRALDEAPGVRAKVAELLAFDADPAGRAALVGRIEKDGDLNVARKAAEALRRWEPEGSLDADYALLGARFRGLASGVAERLRDRGDPAKMLAALPRIQPANEDEYLRPLVTALLTRDPLPVDAAAAEIGSVHDRTAAVAAQILARAGKAAGKAHGKGVAAALRAAGEAWQKARAEVRDGKKAESTLAPVTDRYRRLVDAAGKLEVGPEEVIAAATLGGDDPLARPVRREALSAIGGGFAKKAGLDVLAAAATGNDARMRSLAAASLRALSPDRAAEVSAALVDDRSTLMRLVAPGDAAAGKALRAAAANVHTQGVTLPWLVASGDVEGLAAALRDRKLGDAARVGAAEALGRVATEAALVALYAVASSADEDEELRKAAYRAARRGRRYQKKQAHADA